MIWVSFVVVIENLMLFLVVFLRFEFVVLLDFWFNVWRLIGSGNG